MISDIDLLNWEDSHGFRFTHDLFRFPGKFHPPLVEHILKTFQPTGVTDPMAGVGTVAVEAKAAGIPSLSLDIDPVSSFFTKVKTTPIPVQTLEEAWKDLSASFDRFRRGKQEIERRKFMDIRIDIMRKGLEELQARDLERFLFWFRRYCLLDYARIEHSIFNGGLPRRNKNIRLFFWACLLSSIRRISFADPQPVSGLEITKRMKEKLENGWVIDVFSEFERRVNLAIVRMVQYNDYMRKNSTEDTPAFVRREDCANLGKVRIASDFKPNLIMFSPPYCNAIEYWRRHRLEYFLGRFLTEDDAVQLKHRFIGRTVVNNQTTSPHRVGIRSIDKLLYKLEGTSRIKQGAHKARVLAQYFNDMALRLRIFNDYLPNGGHCVIVVGDSTSAGYKIPTGAVLTSLGLKAGFIHVKTVKYAIRNRVMQYPTDNSKIEHESIIVLEKP